MIQNTKLTYLLKNYKKNNINSHWIENNSLQTCLEYSTSTKEIPFSFTTITFILFLCYIFKLYKK